MGVSGILFCNCNRVPLSIPLVIKSFLSLLAFSLICKLDVTYLSFRTNCSSIFICGVVLMASSISLVACADLLTFNWDSLWYQRKVSCSIVMVQDVEIHLCRIITILWFISLRSSRCDSHATVEMDTAWLERSIKLVVVIWYFKHAIVYSRRLSLWLTCKRVITLCIFILCALHAVYVFNLLHLAHGWGMDKNLVTSFLLLACWLLLIPQLRIISLIQDRLSIMSLHVVACLLRVGLVVTSVSWGVWLFSRAPLMLQNMWQNLILIWLALNGRLLLVDTDIQVLILLVLYLLQLQLIWIARITF